MTTTFSRGPTPADPGPMRKVIPGFGLASILQHFWHPHSWEDGATEWLDEFGSRFLTVSGDDSIVKVTEDERPYLRLTETAAFAEGTDMTEAETGTLFIVARINTGDQIVTNGTIINNGRSSIQMNTEDSTTVSLSDGTASTTASLDEWHLFTLTTPTDTLRTRFTIDDVAITATNVSAGASRSVRVGTTVPSKREMDVMAVWTTTALPAATITDEVWPRVQAWITGELPEVPTEPVAWIPESEKGVADGVATLDGSALIPDAQIPPGIARDSEVSSAVAAEAALARNGDNITSGTVADARIASTIMRDSELDAATAALIPGPSDTADALDAEIEQAAPVTVNVRKYGVLGANTAAQNDTGMTALFAAHTAGVILAFPEEGTYLFNTTWPTRNDLGVRGVGKTTRLKWVSVPAFNLTTWIERFSLADAVMENSSGGDHLFTMSATGGFVYSKFRDCGLFTNDTGKSIMYMLSTGTPNFFGTKFSEVQMERLVGATVPAIDLTCSIAAGMNTVEFAGGLWHSHLANTTPFFRAEVTTTTTYFSKWSFKRIIGEQNLGGMIHMYSANAPTIEQVVDHDAAASTYSDHLFKFSKTTGSTSRAVKFDQSGSAGVAVLAAGKGHLYIDGGAGGHDVGKIINAGNYGVSASPDNAGTIRRHGGGFANSTTTTTASLTLDPSHGTILVNSPSVVRTITLPDPTALLVSGDVPIGREFKIKSINATAVTVVSAGSATIDGATSASVAPDAGGTFVTDGTNWYRVDAGGIRTLAAAISVDAKTVGTTALYTVPTGKTAVITEAVIRCTAATAITVAASLGIGVAAGEDDIFASTALTGLTATTKEWHFVLSGLTVKNAAAAVIKVGVDTAATGTSQTLAVDLIGYLI